MPSPASYQIRTHLWKADERSVRRAAEWTGLDVVELHVLEYTSLNVYGCFPASGGRTCLVVLERPIGDSTCEADRAQSGVPCVESSVASTRWARAPRRASSSGCATA